ncbi:hypothetical protein GBAR_LOCUS27449 [Geodia barretti]|uniref:CAP-Gly domain-containing protein n=1 Tax=Geodia barretti TaxID=519541 RepID=A0AA35TLL0_GEOBA|nr:hypothetical protein GBAR_LOCUS27449 [Geodia barretti]
MSAEITSLTAQLKEREEEVRVKEDQLKEMKNMNAALENQLTEYMDALELQNQSVKRSVESSQRTSAEVAEYEQQMAQTTEYMRKQQLEYQEALQSLQKKVGRAEETEKENLKIHQLNLNLAGELEDYRHQTKTLMADLRAKEEEIASLRETVGTRGQLSSDRTQLELDSMQQKCDAWKEEVEKLSPLRDQLARATQDNSQLHREVGRLRQDNSRLEAELARASADNTGLARQLEETESAQEVGGERGTRGELDRKVSDYDQLMERVTELQQVRVQLENELSPLRAERANILSENAALREGSNPDKYLQLKTNYNKLSEQCVALQKYLTDESKECEQMRQRLAEEKAINARMEEANHELQVQLEATTDERSLQAIRDRVERYRNERDQLKVAVSQYQERDREQQETIHSIQMALEEATAQNSNQDSTGVWQDQVATLTLHLEESNKRMLRYREERNTARIMHKSLQEQINTLQATVEQLQNSRSYDTYTSGQLDTALLTRLQLTDEGSTERPTTGSPHEDAYSPEEYSEQTAQQGGGGGGEGRGGRRSSKQSFTSTASGSSSHKHDRLSSASNRSFSPSGATAELYTEVTMKDGVTRNLVIERPRHKLSYKSKPEVIVKRKGGKYETGVLAYVGVLDGKEMAGVILDLPTGSNDGAFKDGRYYFRW